MRETEEAAEELARLNSGAVSADANSEDTSARDSDSDEAAPEPDAVADGDDAAELPEIFVEARDPLASTLPRRSAAAEAIPDDAKVVVDVKLLEEYLGVPRYRRQGKGEKAAVGLVAGLAWTERGGEKLDIEATLMPGKGKLALTGQLGDVMQESGQAAMSYIRSRATSLGIPRDFHERVDVHVHVPEGAIPKDGPSAGITLATAMTSALTGIAVHNDLAMTGEITLRGHVLPIGGLKEKVLAAHRLGLDTILVPRDNEKDLRDVPEEIREKLTIHLVATMDEVLELALVSPLTPLPAEEVLPPTAPDKGLEPPLAH